MIDKHSPGVFEFVKWLEDELEKKRNALERPKTDIETATLRGNVKTLRIVLGKLTGDDEDIGTGTG